MAVHHAVLAVVVVVNCEGVGLTEEDAVDDRADDNEENDDDDKYTVKKWNTQSINNHTHTHTYTHTYTQ